MGRGSGRGGGGALIKPSASKRGAAASRVAPQPSLSPAAHEEVQALKAQISSLQEALAHAQARVTAAESHSDAAQREGKSATTSDEHCAKHVASAPGARLGPSPPGSATPDGITQETRVVDAVHPRDRATVGAAEHGETTPPYS